MSFRPQGSQVVAWLAGTALILLFFWKLAFTNLILARGDIFLYFYPYWDYRAQALLAGHLPLWNPYLFMGAPFLANSQAGVFYPLNWPLVFFPAPIAIKISIIAHLSLAFTGAQMFARRALGHSALAAFLAATLFALGGYLTTQVEHINQLQGLAWFPWMLLVTGGGTRTSSWPQSVFRIAPLAMLIALQLLAGHTQTVFISLVGLAIYVLIIAGHLSPRFASNLLPSSLLALALSAVQLLPTLELSQESLRSGGLPWREALSFSLDPQLLGRALLPGYSRSLYTEFVAYVGVVGLALAVFGVKRERHRIAMLVLAGVGLIFALGVFNPLYALLAYFPPFNLFRVPARWLCLFAFGLAMLAGYGLDRVRAGNRLSKWGLAIGGSLPAALILLTLMATNFTPPGETGPLGAPVLRDWLGWLLPLGALITLLLAPVPDRWRAPGLVAVAIAGLFAASFALPFNRLTAPDAYTSIRPAMTQLLIHSSSEKSAQSVDHSPLPRFLSMSALRFDPGDLAELRGIWEPQLPKDAVDDAIVATKHKEVLSPNLPLTWGLPAVDGFDGGILPLKHYAEFTQLFTGALLTGTLSADGRLRENMTTAPDPRLLSLVNARYLITDKVNDAWVKGVFYDLQFTLSLKDGEQTDIAYLPKFQATALGLVMDNPSGSVRVEFSDGSKSDLPITDNRLLFTRPLTPTRITLIGPLTLRGLSLIDERTGAFQALTLGRYRLAHSGDVKIYENLDTLPRAFVVPQAIVIADDVAARSALADPTFVPTATVILAESPAAPISATTTQLATITAYSPEHILLTAQGPGYLVLTDAYYPGWITTVDGQPTPSLRADIMFRAVALPEGTHTVEFRFEPRLVTIGVWVSGVAWVTTMAALGLATLKTHTPPS